MAVSTLQAIVLRKVNWQFHDFPSYKFGVNSLCELITLRVEWIIFQNETNLLKKSVIAIFQLQVV